MPIDIETFEREEGFEETDSYGDRIVRFLAANDDKAFQRDEIAEGTDIPPDTVSSVLSRLKARDLVRHKPPYWAIGDPDQVAAAMDLSRDLAEFDDRFGPEEMDAWRDAGSDRPHPSDRDGDG